MRIAERQDGQKSLVVEFWGRNRRKWLHLASHCVDRGTKQFFPTLMIGRRFDPLASELAMTIIEGRNPLHPKTVRNDVGHIMISRIALRSSFVLECLNTPRKDRTRVVKGKSG